MWVYCGDRQPPVWGEYRVLRKGIGNRPAYEDHCKWTPPINASEGYWINRKSTIIRTVIAWWEEETGDVRG